MPRRKTASIKDIARASGASLTTVSLVLNRRDDRISSATRDRVLEAAARLRYRPSRLAQGLQSRRAGLLAILVPELRHAFADVYFGEIISAVHDFASGIGYKILLEVAHPAFVDSAQHRDLFDRHFVDGMLCIGVTNKDAYLSDFEDRARPMIVVNNYVPDLRLNCVRCDYCQAGRLAGGHLTALGHRRIAMIHGAPEVQTTRDFRAGAEEALAVAGLELAENRLADGMFTEEGGAEAVDRLLARDPSITAWLVGNDKMAIGALTALKRAGRRVPHDVSVVGCDDIHQAAFTEPPLTTVHLPLYEIGRQACRRLLELIEGAAETIQEIHDVDLTVRGSTGPARINP